jgi:hypothetical protein
MARAVQEGKYLYLNKPYAVPQLKGRALELYEKYFGQTGTRKYNVVEKIRFARVPNFLQPACTSHAMMLSHISG